MTNDIRITKPQALKALRESVAEKGDEYVYPKPNGECLYSVGGQPSCLVGHALHRLGVPIDVLKQIDIELVGESDIYSAAENTLKDAGVRIGPKALKAFKTAQVSQDIGQTWGTALGNAEEV